MGSRRRVCCVVWSLAAVSVRTLTSCCSGHTTEAHLLQTPQVRRLEGAVLEARDRAVVFNSTSSYFVIFRSQKAAAMATSCNIHPLRRELFKVGFVWCACMRACVRVRVHVRACVRACVRSP